MMNIPKSRDTQSSFLPHNQFRNMNIVSLSPYPHLQRSKTTPDAKVIERQCSQPLATFSAKNILLAIALHQLWSPIIYCHKNSTFAETMAIGS